MMSDTAEVLGVVLAGGSSRRFGSPKEAAVLGGQTLGQRAVCLLRRVTGLVGVVGTPGAAFGKGDGDVRVRPDRRPGLGPVGGISTALAWARELNVGGVLCIPCDTPFIPPELLDALIRTARKSEAWCVNPPGQPACAYYDTRCGSHVDRFIEGGGRSLAEMTRALPEHRTLSTAAVRGCGDPERIFLNVNDVAALGRAERFLEASP